MKCVRVINKVLITKCGKKNSKYERETLKAGKEQEDLLFNVCSFQAVIIANKLSIKELNFSVFSYTTDLQKPSD